MSRRNYRRNSNPFGLSDADRVAEVRKNQDRERERAEHRDARDAERQTTEAQHAPLRIEIDANGTPRLYRGKEYLGVASQREVELYNSHAPLLSACEAAEKALRSYQFGNGSPDLAEEVANHLRTAIASARKEQV